MLTFLGFILYGDISLPFSNSPVFGFTLNGIRCGGDASRREVCLLLFLILNFSSESVERAESELDLLFAALLLRVSDCERKDTDLFDLRGVIVAKSGSFVPGCSGENGTLAASVYE